MAATAASAASARPIDTAAALGRVCVVTGCNTGIGFQTAQALWQRGQTVILACRTTRKALEAARRMAATVVAAALLPIAADVCDDAVTWVATAPRAPSPAGAAPPAAPRGSGGVSVSRGVPIHRIGVLRLDLTSLLNVRAFARTFVASGLPLHTLVLNAGLNGFGGINDARTPEDINLVYGVNFVAHAYLSLLLLPLMIRTSSRSMAPSGEDKAAPGAGAGAGSGQGDESKDVPLPGRIVGLSSVTHRTATGDFAAAAHSPGMASYADSKLALTMWLYHMQHQLDVAGVRSVQAVAANPGGVYSDIWRSLPACVKCWVTPLMKCLLLNTVQGSATSVAGATLPGLRGGEYLTPYWVPDGCCRPTSQTSLATRCCNFASRTTVLVFDSLGPFTGPWVARSSDVSYNRRAQKQLWEGTVALIDGALVGAAAVGDVASAEPGETKAPRSGAGVASVPEDAAASESAGAPTASVHDLLVKAIHLDERARGSSL